MQNNNKETLNDHSDKCDAQIETLNNQRDINGHIGTYNTIKERK